MKHLFLNAELSQLAKDKGFNEPCLAFWDESCSWSMNPETKNFDIHNRHGLRLRDWEGECLGTEEGQLKKWDEIVNAPLYQQIVDWLREEHKTIVHILPFGEGLCAWYIQKTSWMYEFPVEERRLENGYYNALEKAVKQALNELPDNQGRAEIT